MIDYPSSSLSSPSQEHALQYTSPEFLKSVKVIHKEKVGTRTCLTIYIS